jgi:hypothetical protein
MEIEKLREGWLRGVFASEDGQIWGAPAKRHPSWKQLKSFLNKGAYESIKVWDRDKLKDVHITVHRYVCYAFHGAAPQGKPEVRHLDSNSRNNHASNLCWGTRAENELDRTLNRLKSTHPAAIIS